MPSFPLRKLPLELQLLVWHHARASIGQVIVGEIDFNKDTLTLAGHNLHRTKDYLRLLSICQISRQEALREPLVFFAWDDDYWGWAAAGIDLLDGPGSKYDQSVSIRVKHWHFGHAFSDILLPAFYTDLRHHEEWHEPGSLSLNRDLMGNFLAHFFGPTIRRVHVHDEMLPMKQPIGPGKVHPQAMWRTDKPVDATFSDADALDFSVPLHKCGGLREVARQGLHGEPSRNSAQQLVVNVEERQPDTYVHSLGDLIKLEDFIKVVAHMRSRFPNLEYVSVVSCYCTDSD